MENKNREHAQRNGLILAGNHNVNKSYNLEWTSASCKPCHSPAIFYQEWKRGSLKHWYSWMLGYHTAGAKAQQGNSEGPTKRWVNTHGGPGHPCDWELTQPLRQWKTRGLAKMSRKMNRQKDGSSFGLWYKMEGATEGNTVMEWSRTDIQDFVISNRSVMMDMDKRKRNRPKKIFW